MLVALSLAQLIGYFFQESLKNILTSYSFVSIKVGSDFLTLFKLAGIVKNLNSEVLIKRNRKYQYAICDNLSLFCNKCWFSSHFTSRNWSCSDFLAVYSKVIHFLQYFLDRHFIKLN